MINPVGKPRRLEKKVSGTNRVPGGVKLRVHDKPFNEYTDIDKYLVAPKKLWEEFEPGEQTIRINGKQIKVRVYDIPCTCVGSMHNHRLIDLRGLWEELGIKAGEEVLLGK